MNKEDVRRGEAREKKAHQDLSLSLYMQEKLTCCITESRIGWPCSLERSMHAGLPSDVMKPLVSHKRPRSLWRRLSYCVHFGWPNSLPWFSAFDLPLAALPQKARLETTAVEFPRLIAKRVSPLRVAQCLVHQCNMEIGVMDVGRSKNT